SILAEEYEVRTKVLGAAMVHIEEKLLDLDEATKDTVRTNYQNRFERLQHTELPLRNPQEKDTNPALAVFNRLSHVQLELIEVERELIKQLHKQGQASEEVLRKIEWELDIEETRLQLEIIK
ncbi:MAG: hypothetical protein J7576_24360, partial [Siphonobacter aquaeclarae]|nr:hypothetical protein [Siphonobacter aquaeclarae]